MAARTFYDNTGDVSQANPGTGDFILQGTAPPAALAVFRIAKNKWANNASVEYLAVDNADSTKWEIGFGTFTTAANHLTRNVTNSSNSDAAVNFTGTCNIYGIVSIDSLAGAVLTTTGDLLSHDGTKLSRIATGAANQALVGGATPGWTGILTSTALGSTSTDGWVLTNTTAAAAGAQQFSPRLRLTGQGWKTTATAASQTTDWIFENQPVQGAANPTSNLMISNQINAGGYTGLLSLTSGGTLNINAATGTYRINGADFLTSYGLLNSTFVGGSGLSSASGVNNTAMGSAALGGLTSGNQNVGIGRQAANGVTVGSRNVMVGYQAGNGSSNSSDNTVVGSDAFEGCSGSGNTAVGSSAGPNPIGGSYTDCIFLGLFAGQATPTSTTGAFIVGGYDHPITDAYLGGDGDKATSGNDAHSYIIHGSGGNGTNKTGGNVTIAGGIGTGTAVSGDVIFQSAPTGSSGTTPNTLAERGRISNTALTITSADVIVATAGKGLQIKGGSNAKIGTAVLSSGTVTVSTTAVTANSLIFLTDQTGGSNLGNLSVGTITAGTSFVINSSNILDSSTVAWLIIEKG